MIKEKSNGSASDGSSPATPGPTTGANGVQTPGSTNGPLSPSSSNSSAGNTSCKNNMNITSGENLPQTVPSLNNDIGSNGNSGVMNSVSPPIRSPIATPNTCMNIKEEPEICNSGKLIVYYK